MGRVKELMMEFCGVIFPDSWDDQEAFQTLILDSDGDGRIYDGDPNRGALLRWMHSETTQTDVPENYDAYNDCREHLSQGSLVVPQVSLGHMHDIFQDFQKNKTPQSAPPLTLRRVARALDLIKDDE